MLPSITQEELFKLFNIQEAPQENKAKFLEALEELVNQITIDTILAHLKDEDRKQFILLLEEELSGEKAVFFAKEKIPSINQLLEENVREELNSLNLEE